MLDVGGFKLRHVFESLPNKFTQCSTDFTRAAEERNFSGARGRGYGRKSFLNSTPIKTDIERKD